MSEPKCLTRMKLSECWGDSLNIEELKEVNAYIEYLQQKNKELENINDKLSSALNSTEQRIDKAIGFIDMIYEIGSYSKSTGLDNEEVKELYSILQGKEVK